MKKVPIYAQHDRMDCGPTCLRMISAYYGRKISLASLKQSSFVTKNGSSLLGISIAAEKLGFRTIGLQINFQELSQDVLLPCIAHWNQDHFIVVEKILKNKKQIYVQVVDPRGERIIYTKNEFCNCWYNGLKENQNKGIVLLLEPTPLFYEQEKGETKDNKKGVLFLLGYLKPYKQLIYQLILGLIAGSILQLILPFLTQSIVDFGITNQNLSYIYLVLIAQLALTIGNVSVEFIRGWILLHIGIRINISMISDYLIKLMKLPISYFDVKITGDIIQRINDHSRIQNLLTNSSLSTLFSIFNIIIFGIVILIYNKLIFGIFILGSLMYISWIKLFMKKRAELDCKSFSQLSASQGNMIELITGMQEIKLNSCEQLRRWKWESIQANLFKLSTKGLSLGQYQESGGVLINQMKNIIITAFVAKLVVDGKITLGMMLSIQYIIGQLNAPIDQLISFMRQLQDAKLSLDRLQEVYEMDDEIINDENLISDIPKYPDIEIKNLTFRYNPLTKQPTLQNINLKIPAGKKTAIVGMSGSGKTTILKLLLGFYSAEKGEIIVGQTNLRDFNIREWRKKCGIVMQDGFIFSDTIAKNIAPSDECIDKDKLLYAVELANIKDFIESLPLSYNTKIGIEEHGLSQGQKQRILIARAIYKNPEFILLDEATNALDTNNELSIMNNLEKFFKGRTSIIVAHRLSTVRNADQIVVIEQGKITELGTHDELINNHGQYYKLVKNQIGI